MTERDDTTSESAADDDPGIRLAADLEHAREQLAQVEAEYAEILADGGVIQEDRDAARAMVEQARGALETARRAMDRFESGQYGRCVRCGGEIGPERLEALPDVETCINCHGGSPR